MVAHRCVALAAAALALAGCEVPAPECGILCDPNQTCARGLVCGDDGYCHGDEDTNHCTQGGELTGGPFNYVFVTSQKFTPGAPYAGPGSLTFENPEDADRICADLAATSMVKGVREQTSYRAWISSTVMDARDRLRAPNSTVLARGFIRPDERPFADSIDSLIQGHIFYPARLDENGRDVVGSDPSFIAVATGTRAAGTAGMATWTTGAAHTTGHAGATTACWTECTTAVSTGPGRLYCIGVDHDSPLGIVPATGRRAFVSSSAFTPSMGVQAADQLCAMDAAAVGIAGDFIALISTPAEAASSRFTDGPSWVRLDGVTWVRGVAELADANLLTALNVTPAQNYEGEGLIWTGSVDPGSTSSPTSSCGGWSSSSANAIVGRVYMSNVRFFNETSSYACNSPGGRLYCLER